MFVNQSKNCSKIVFVVGFVRDPVLKDMNQRFEYFTFNKNFIECDICVQPPGMEGGGGFYCSITSGQKRNVSDTGDLVLSGVPRLLKRPFFLANHFLSRHDTNATAIHERPEPTREFVNLIIRLHVPSTVTETPRVFSTHPPPPTLSLPLCMCVST